MTSKNSRPFTDDEKAEFLADAANPEYRTMAGPPRGKTPTENFDMMLQMLKFVCEAAPQNIRKPAPWPIPTIPQKLL